jgi:Cu+-exporting ATPase
VNWPTAETRVDPVCGMRVDVGDAQADGRTLAYGGETYVFCSDGCMAEFRASPETYEGQASAPDDAP